MGWQSEVLILAKWSCVPHSLFLWGFDMVQFYHVSLKLFWRSKKRLAAISKVAQRVDWEDTRLLFGFLCRDMSGRRDWLWKLSGLWLLKRL